MFAARGDHWGAADGETLGSLGGAAGELAAGWGARGGRRALVVAAARHAVDFHTWRSLARDGGVARAGVVELAAAMVWRAAAMVWRAAAMVWRAAAMVWRAAGVSLWCPTNRAG